MARIDVTCSDDEDMPGDAVRVEVVDMYAPTDLHPRQGNTVVVRTTIPLPSDYGHVDQVNLVFANPEDAAAYGLQFQQGLQAVIEAQLADGGGDAA